MNNEEFSNGFTTLLNSYGSIGLFGDQASHREIVLNEYEKSVFLTQAQDIIVKSYFDKTMSPNGQGFDDSSRRQADFSSLIKVTELSPSAPAGTLFDDRGILFKLPTTMDASSSAVLMIVQEKLIKESASGTKKQYVIKPISHEEYDRIMSQPYGKPLKKQAWRLFQNQSTGFDLMSEIIPRDTLGGNESWKYRIRFVKRPIPIILENLTDGLSIDGMTAETTCELNPILHMDILLKAVELAYTSRGGNVAKEQ